MWSLGYDASGTMAHIKNIYWEGYNFYSIINTGEFGGAYFGTGVPALDIAFML